MKEPQTKEFYDFGAFRLDVEKHRLWRGDELIALTPKEFELLRILVENPGRVLEKDELHERIWKGTFVEDGTLTRNISWLRKKLAAGNEEGEKFIETCPKRGYRFLPAVTKSPNENLLVIEEQTRTRIRLEETISVAEPDDSVLHSARLELGAAENKAASVARVPPSVWLALGIFAISVVGFAIYQNFFSRREPKIVLVSSVRPFSGLPGRESLPAFSPDGKQVAFVWNGGDGEIQDIYVRLMGAGEPVRLTKGENIALFPAFSPDGKFVAFSRSFPDASKIYIVPALGGAERKIAEVRSGGTSFSYSPDGQRIVIADRDSANSANGLFFVNVETSGKQRLTTPPKDFIDQDPRFSPDGKSIAFRRASNTNGGDLYVVSATGNESARRLTFDDVQIRGLAWSADGERIIFSSRRGQASSSNLWQVALAGGEPVLVMTGGKNPTNLAVSPDGKTIAYVEEFEDINIWRINKSEPLATGGGSDFKKVIASARADHSQQISPDGSKIVFVSERTGTPAIWLANADGSNPLQLTTSGSGSPRFSPDGGSIAFGLSADGKGRIYIISADGGPSHRLTDGPADDKVPAWSADGASVYFSSNRSGDSQIWKMPVAGGEARQVTRHGGFEGFESPDGKWFYYTKDRGVAGLWRVETEGGEETPVAELADAGYWRSWTVTQNGICYVGRAGSPPYQIKFYSFLDGQTKTLATMEKAPLWNFSGLAASADGKIILYAQYDQNASSVVLADLVK